MSSRVCATADELLERAAKSRDASRVVARCSREVKDGALRAIAASLRAHQPAILQANAHDCARVRESNGREAMMLDRLLLTPERVRAMATDIEAVAELPDSIGEVFDRCIRPNGLQVAKRRVPLGVVGVIYEARPNVTSDIAALCLKAGNAALLRGGREAIESNVAITTAIQEGLAEAGLPSETVQLIASPDRGLVERMLRLRGQIDVIVPRGGKELIEFVVDHATVPVIETGAGVCHTYVDRAADAEMATRIVFNAKVRRPTICNALDTLLVHRGVASSWLPALASAWAQAGVQIHADATAGQILAAAGLPWAPAVEEDWGREFLSLAAAVKVVNSLDEALDHIQRYGSGHSDAIVTSDVQAAKRFVDEVDAAAVYVNASTQFTDGGEFGLGAEVGISTQKMHARGPMGVRELTTYKWVVEGSGQVRP